MTLQESLSTDLNTLDRLTNIELRWKGMSLLNIGTADILHSTSSSKVRQTQNSTKA